MNCRRIIAVAAAILAAVGGQAAAPAQGRAGALLLPLRADDVDAYAKELPGENMGEGGEFSVGRSRYVRLDGRHLTFRTATGVKACVVGATAAKSWTFETAGTVACAGVGLAIRVNTRAKSDDGQPVVVTVTQGRRVSSMTGLWQGLD